ncbi:hypothetical protein [Candidatus Sneabacter namystus]|uniref:Uncharacterized protein n=1 Tax=Candidatus Sneabacter namystus TaxID=2601646 RepID=A0A5C0UIX8_9RICK|nr:hypothetical protein [Candidatus Sneabacter namystus]QEK39402.1 hypothetical protein FZC37_00390 [Candidatus Sneabacter namystus]
MDIKLNTEELILGIDNEEQGFASPLKARNRDRDCDRARDRDCDRPSLSDDVMCDASGATDIDFGADEELAG